MSFKFNSDKEQIRANAPSVLGDSQFTIRSGTSSDEKEVMRTLLDPTTKLPRVGINRTGSRIDRIVVTNSGNGYTVQPSVTISAPQDPNGVQALASASLSQEGRVSGILIDDPGNGYTSAPSISITGGNGAGATAQVFLDTVDFELDINGAIRTSTSIISDTARILNLDIDNLVTPDAQYRAPNLKTFVNNTGTPWSPDRLLQKNTFVYRGPNVYQAMTVGTTSTNPLDPPLHIDGEEVNGNPLDDAVPGVLFKHIGFRVSDENEVYYNETGEAGIYPRSITPLLGDKSDKIATTEYVLNLATNDVGGRIYVSQQIGNDENDGRSAVSPVRTIKKACQLAWATPGVKESIIISGGDYVEDNPISIPPDASIVGDNLRLVIIRPANPRKHIFKFGDKNYVIGVTYRDAVDSDGFSTFTWDFAMVFDDKQRITYDYDINGDFGTQFPIGHQVFGDDIFRATYQSNGGLQNLVSGIELRGVNAGGIVRTSQVSFNETTGNQAYQAGTFDYALVSGSVTAGETLVYGGANSQRFQPETAYEVGDIVWTEEHVYNVSAPGTSGETNPTHDSGSAGNGDGTLEFTYIRDTYSLVTTDIISIRPEGEVVSTNEDITSVLPIYRIDFSLQGDPSIATGGFGDYGSAEDLGGIIFYTNPLVEDDNIHDFKEGQEIEIAGLSTNAPDLSFLNGKQRIYKVIEDPDGRSRRFVIPKKNLSLTDNNYDPGQFAQVTSYSKSVTLSLLNSPFKFNEATPVARRYQDAVNQIRNNREFIADEVVSKINDQFKKEYYSVYDIGGDGGFDFKIYLGTSRFVHDYVSGGTVTYNGTTYNITNFVYDNFITGTATVTIDNALAGAIEDDIVQIADILLECDVDGVTTQKVYPSFSIPVSDEKCRRDVKHFINAITADLEFGSNHNVIEAAKKYIDGTNTEIDFVNNEIIQTVRALEYARELMIYAMRKWRTGDGLTTDPVYTPQYSSLPQYFDPTIIDDLNAGGACNNVKSAIDTLAYLFVDVLANDASGTYLDAAYLIARNRDHIADEAYRAAIVQYPSLGLSNIDERKCRRDINFILTGLLRDLVLGGNFGIVNAAESYYTGTQLTGIPESELGPTIYAFNQVRDLCIEAMRNWKSSIGNPITPQYTPIPQFTDNTILADPNGDPLCANVEASITTSFDLLIDILDGTIVKGATTKTTGTLLDVAGLYNYPDSYITDQQGTRIAVRSTYDDYPIIEASPYTQNSSIISKLGGGGALIDGSKVKQPNCPFPGLTVEGTAKFPNQGKSMVASAFTIVSEGGVGYKIIEDGYTQLVSVFCIFCSDGVLAESGGYASITNSATNFGIFALRARGYREEAYSFDSATITNVSSTPTGRTILSVSGLGREPLEHYVGKIDGFENVSPDVEYFVDVVEGVTVGPPFSAQLTFESGSGGPMEIKNTETQNVISLPSLVGETLRLHRPSIVNSSSHTWEYAGSGTNYLALPENGGVKVEANEQVSEAYGRTYVSGTDELGDFKVGTFARIENRTGNITFTGTVTISEVEFLKLKGGDVVVTGFDNSNTLGGANSSDSKLPTQKAVKDFITNNLGPYINKPYSTNPVPRALVELTDSGKISEDQIPPLRPFQVYTVANQAERTAIEGALAGDIAIQQDITTSFILNNDNESLFASFAVDPTLQFTIGDVFTGDVTGGKIQATEYRQGVVYQLNITDGGSGYVTPPIVTVSGNQQSGGVPANVTAEIANGQVVILNIELFNGYKGGKGYTVPPTITIAAPAGSGTQATANALIESRLYGDIVNNVKIEDTDSIQSSDLPPETININRVINTSASNTNNWVSLSTNQIAASDITSGVISTARLASNAAGEESAANSFTFLRGDQAYAPAVQTIKGPETRYFARLKVQANSGSSQLVFESSSNFLKGHEVSQITGIQVDTNIDGVLTEDGETTVTLDKFLTATLPAGTVLEFSRGSSPLTFESSQTQGGFVDQIVIADGGQNFDAGPFFDVPLTGGAPGTGLRANIITNGGVVTDVTITSSGQGYTSDFAVSSSPTEIGSGSGLSLLAKVSTVNRQYANVAIDIQRVSDLTTSGDAYGTLGVARFLKSQFLIGDAGNGSVAINTGPDSGLDADTLDGAQGSFYLNSSNQNAGFLPTERLSGTYNISISNTSGNTLRLKAADAALSNPTPDEFSAGIIADTKNNSADGLSDGGSKHLVLTVRNGGSDFDATFGGVRQLAFTDGTAANGGNLWIRGSYNSPANAFGNWNQIWSSGNDGVDSGLDADKMDGRQGKWYQTATHMNYGILSDNRLPMLQSAKDNLFKFRVLDWTGTPRYTILVRDELLNSTPFVSGETVNLYDNGGNGVGEITLTKVTPVQDVNDAANNFTLLTGSLTSGNFISATFIGTGGVANAYAFQDYNLSQIDDNVDGLVDGTYEVIVAESVGGNARLRLGREGTASDPSIYFKSSQLTATNYNSAIIASGGNTTDGSGTLEVKVANSSGFTILGNEIWNAGSVQFYSANIAPTLDAQDNITVRSAVMRDANGNFAAGTITAALTGAASANVLKAGDTMTGALVIGSVTAANQALEVSGRADFLSNITVASNLTVDTNVFHVNATDDAVGFGTSTPDTGIPIHVFRGSVANDAITTLMKLETTRGDFINTPGGSQIMFKNQDNNNNTNEAFIKAVTVNNTTYGDNDESNTNFIFRQTNNGTAQDNVIFTGDGRIGLGEMNPTERLHVDGNAYVSQAITSIQGLTLGTTANNDDAPIYFLGSTGGLVGGGPDQLSNFRVGNGIIGGDIFEITANDGSQGSTSWKAIPALAIQGTNNRVAINTTVFSGQDQTDPQNIIDRDYSLNVEGDLNINNGNLFVDNAPFVTSRWTESNDANGANIYRLSRVGINKEDPAYTLHIGVDEVGDASVNIEGTTYSNGKNTSVLHANGDPQYLDSYGIFKTNRTVASENTTIPANTNCMSAGPIEIGNNVIITVANGGSWTIV